MEGADRLPPPLLGAPMGVPFVYKVGIVKYRKTASLALTRHSTAKRATFFFNQGKYNFHMVHFCALMYTYITLHTLR